MCKILTVTVAFLVASSAFFLEHQYLVVLEVFEDLTFYRSAFYYRCAYLNLTVVVCEQDFVEAHGRINIALETVYIELPTLFSLELLTCYFYYYVHFVCMINRMAKICIFL